MTTLPTKPHKKSVVDKNKHVYERETEKTQWKPTDHAISLSQPKIATKTN